MNLPTLATAARLLAADIAKLTPQNITAAAGLVAGAVAHFGLGVTATPAEVAGYLGLLVAACGVLSRLPAARKPTPAPTPAPPTPPPAPPAK